MQIRFQTDDYHSVVEVRIAKRIAIIKHEGICYA